MNITHLELATNDLQAQREYYAHVLQLPVDLSADQLLVQAGETKLVFNTTTAGFAGAYHFAFNIPENQFPTAKEWIASRVSLLRDEQENDEFTSSSWNSTSLYFKDPVGNILEFIARHALNNAVYEEFNSRHLLNISEIGLPSENVIAFADDLCAKLNLSVFRQKPNETFTPVGDDNGLLILPVQGCIWYPNTGVPARMLPVWVKGNVDELEFEVRGVPYEISRRTPSMI